MFKTVSLIFSYYLRYIAENLRSKVLTAVLLRTSGMRYYTDWYTSIITDPSED